MQKKTNFLNKDPLVSIVMPVKDAGLYLVDCLESIKKQTEKKWELIAIDDHSSDNSLSILNQYSNIDERIKIFNNNGQGIIEALKLAYQKSRGEFITRMDADDIMKPRKIEILKSNLQSNGIGNIAIGGVEYFSSKGVGDGYKKYEEWLNRLTSKGTNFTEIYKECVIPSPSWMIHRRDFDSCGGFNSSIYPEDYDLCFRLYRENINVIPCQEILHRWRDHASRSSRNLDEYSDNSFLELKVKYFIELDYNHDKELIIWGAGKKGKKAASILKNHNIRFRWICNNENKIGKDIYGIKMEAPDSIVQVEDNQLLVLVANIDEQLEIKNHSLTSSEKTELFFFC